MSRKLTSEDLIGILFSDKSNLGAFKQAYFRLHQNYRSEFHNTFLEKIPLKAEKVEFIIKELSIDLEENLGNLLAPLYGAFRASSQHAELPLISEEILKYLKMLFRVGLKETDLQLGKVCPRETVLKYLLGLKSLRASQKESWLKDALERTGYRAEVLLLLGDPSLEDLYREYYLSVVDPQVLKLRDVPNLQPSDFLQALQKATRSSYLVDFSQFIETWISLLNKQPFTVNDSNAILPILVTAYIESTEPQRTSLEGAFEALVKRGGLCPSLKVLRDNLNRLLLEGETRPSPKVTHYLLQMSEEFKRLAVPLWLLGVSFTDHIREVLQIEGLLPGAPKFPALQDLPLEWPGKIELNIQRALTFPVDPSQTDLPSSLCRNGCVSLLHTSNTKLESFKYAAIAALRLRDFPEELRGKSKNKVTRHCVAPNYQKLVNISQLPPKVPLDPELYQKFEEENPTIQLNIFAFDEGRSFLFPVYRGLTNLSSPPLDLLYYHSYYHPIEDLDKAAKASINLVEGKDYVVRISRPCLRPSTDRRKDGAARKVEKHLGECQCLK